MSGPCTPYFTADDVAADPRLCNAASELVEDLPAHASEVMWVLLGRQFSGPCQVTVRPENDLGCWPRSRFTSTHDFDEAILLDEQTTEVNEVKIDGDVFTAWYVTNGNELRRSDGRRWPASQSLHLPDSSPGTFSVTYTFGSPPPGMVKLAAIEVAVNLYWERTNDTRNRLPADVTGGTRQGTSYRVDRDADKVRQAGPNMPTVMNAMGTFNPTNQRVPPDVYTHAGPWKLHLVSQAGPS